MLKGSYETPKIQEIKMFAEGVLAVSTFMLQEYGSNGEPIELDF